MKLYEGVKESNTISWQNPKPVETAQTKESYGEKLFKTNCTSCHSIDKKLIGPALAWTDSRFGNDSKSKQHVYEYIRNNERVLKEAKSKYYCDLLHEYNGVLMTAFQELSDNDIEAMYGYINSEAKKLKIPKDTIKAVWKDSCLYYYMLGDKLYNMKDSLMKIMVRWQSLIKVQLIFL